MAKKKSASGVKLKKAPSNKKDDPEKPKVIPAKQLKFVHFYVECENATEAAKRAGYSERSAYSIGQRLLNKDVIREKVDELQLEMIEEIDISTKEILAHTAKIAFCHPTTHGKYRAQHKLKALEMLGKYRKLWTDKVEVDTGEKTSAKVEALLEQFTHLMTEGKGERGQ